MSLPGVRAPDRTQPAIARRTVAIRTAAAYYERVNRFALVLVLVSCSKKPPSDEAARLAAFDQYRQPNRVVAALGLRRGQRVADVGAGHGYLTFRLADAVGPEGLVVATEIDDEALDALRAHRAKNVVVRKV